MIGSVTEKRHCWKAGTIKKTIASLKLIQKLLVLNELTGGLNFPRENQILLNIYCTLINRKAENLVEITSHFPPENS